MSQIYDKYYRNILNDNGVPSIIQNKVSAHNINKQKEMFPKCEQRQIPQFFKSNLVSPNRIIKYVYGQYCVYRAFYFQLFKLMFQIQDQERDYVQIFKEIIFDPDIIQRNGQNSRAKRQMRNSKVRDQSMSEVSEQQGFRKQFQMQQKCVAQFMQIVLQNSENFSSFEEYLPYYPQIDESISFILQTFIDNAEQNMDSIQSILQYLSQLFEIQLVVFENCFKFQQSDVFLFIQQKPNEQVWVYIAYNENEEDEDGQQSQQQDNEENDQQVSKEQNSRYDSQNVSQLHSNQQISNQSSLLNPSQLNHDTFNINVSKNQRSSSYHDNVITSESKPQLSNHKPLQNYPRQFNSSSLNEKQQNQRNFSQKNNYNNGDEVSNFNKYCQLISSNHSINQERPFDSILHKQTQQKIGQTSMKQQDRGFHKKQVYFNQQQNLQYKNGHSQLSKLQSFTQAYREDQFNKTPQISHQSFVQNSSYQNSYNKIESNYKDPADYKRITDSKIDTIINMFGDMLGSTANIGSFDDSQKLINGVFGSMKNIAKQEPQRDNDGYYRSITKKLTQNYGSFNNQNSNSAKLIQGNVVNMKKVKIQRQVVFEAQPSNSYALEQEQINQKRSQRSSFQERRRIESIKNNQILMDSEQLRQYNGLQKFDITRERNSSFNVKQSNTSLHQGEDYFDNIEARSYGGDQKRSNRDPVKSTSFHNSHQNSNNSKQLNIQAPNININSVRSQSQTSSIQLNNRNNYYKSDDELYYQNRPKQNSTYQQRQEQEEREFSIKSEEHNPNISNQQKYSQNKYNQFFQHQYKSQQYVTTSNAHLANIPKPPTKAYTHNQQPNKPNKINTTENTQQEDDFFFHPKKQSLNYGLKTIKQVRASKQTNKQSYIVPQNQYGSKISHGNSKISQNDPLYKQKDSRISQKSSKLSHQSSKMSQQNQNYNKVSQNPIGFYQQKYLNKNFEKQKQVETIQTQSSKYLSKVFNTKTYESRKQQSKQLVDDSINNGTFYKQFTNSKVLKLLKQPYRTKVQILRNRFKGEHRATINKFIS